MRLSRFSEVVSCVAGSPKSPGLYHAWAVAQSEYVLTAADDGSRIRLQVSASYYGPITYAVSTLTDVVRTPIPS